MLGQPFLGAEYLPICPCHLNQKQMYRDWGQGENSDMNSGRHGSALEYVTESLFRFPHMTKWFQLHP